MPATSNFFDGDNGAGMVYQSTEPDLRPFYQHVANSTALRVIVYNGDTDPAINSFVAQAQIHAAVALASSARQPLLGCAHVIGCACLYARALTSLAYHLPLSLAGLDLAPRLYSHTVVACVDHRRLPSYGWLRDAVRGLSPRPLPTSPYPPTPLDPLTQPNLTRTNPPPTRYEGSRFDYLTIRGSGHMVPEFKPAAAYELLRAWLKGEDYQPYVTSCKKPH